MDQSEFEELSHVEWWLLWYSSGGCNRREDEVDRFAIYAILPYIYARVRSLLLYKGGNISHAGDVASDVLFRLNRKRNSDTLATQKLITGSEAMATHALLREIQSAVHDYLRKHVPWDQRTAPLDDAVTVTDSAASNDAEEVEHLIATAVEELPDDQREIIRLRYQENLSYDDIAAALNIPKGTAASRHHLAIAKLKKRLGPVFPQYMANTRRSRAASFPFRPLPKQATETFATRPFLPGSTTQPLVAY